MTKWLTTTALMCALALGGSVAASSDSQGTTSKPTTQKPTTQKPTTERPTEKGQTTKGQAGADSTFMQAAAMENMAEVEHGRQATTNASNEAVRKFAQRMVDEHSKANSDLKSLASQKGATLPTELDQKHRAMQQKLEKMKGEEFDRAYMQHMVQAHKQAVTLFQNEAKSGKDPDARAWAEKMLPTLQEHLKMATEINAKLAKGGK